MLYAITGLSNNYKVKNDIKLNYELWTTTAALIEGTVKYRKDLSSIKKLFYPIINEDIKLISIGYVPMSNTSIQGIYNSESLESASVFIDEVMNLKITTEAKFLKWIFTISVLGIFELLKGVKGYKFIDSDKNDLQIKYEKILFESNEQYLFDYFEQKIKNGYLTGNEQRIVLDAFNEMLFLYLRIFLLNYYQIESGVIFRGGVDDSEGTLNGLKQTIISDDFHNIISEYLNNPFEYFSEKSNHSLANDYIIHIGTGLTGDPNLTTSALRFLCKKLEKCFKDKSKIKKNDVFDFLQIFALSLPDYKILTLDRPFIRILKDVDRRSWDLIHSLGYDNP